MLALFSKPKIDQLAHLGRRAAKLFGIAGDQRSRTAAIVQLKLLERSYQQMHSVRQDDEWRVPIRLGPIESVAREVSDPMLVIQPFSTPALLPAQAPEDLENRRGHEEKGQDEERPIKPFRKHVSQGVH